jgi:hypothetical protein
MSLNKAIESGKEHRKQYRQYSCAAASGGKGKCDYCSDGKAKKQKVLDEAHKREMREEKR